MISHDGAHHDISPGSLQLASCPAAVGPLNPKAPRYALGLSGHLLPWGQSAYPCPLPLPTVETPIMLGRAIIAFSLLAIVILGLFAWEHSYVVNSTGVYADITEVRDIPDARADMAHFEYVDPQSGEDKTGTMKLPPIHFFLQVRIEPHTTVQLQRSNADPSKFKPAVGLGLYPVTVFVGLIALIAAIRLPFMLRKQR